MSNSSGREIAFDLLNRLLAGERDCVPLHLGMLLEKSSTLRNCEEHYRWILPAELAGIELSPDTVEEITAAVCAEISANPDAAFISVVSWTGSKLSTRTVALMLACPPRALTLEEYTVSASLLGKYLVHFIRESPDFLPKRELARLVEVLKELQNLEDGAFEGANLYGLRHFVDQLVARLTFDSKRVGREKVAGARAAKTLLRRLLSGERGDVPLYLAKLLEKSSAGADTVYHYGHVLPPELSELRLSRRMADRIIDSLREEFARNPDEAYFFVLCRSLSENAVKAVAKILVNPPRPLSLVELEMALDRLHFVLPFTLVAYPKTLTAVEQGLLVEMLSGLQVPDGSDADQEQQVKVRRLAGDMLGNLHQFGPGPR